jgi:hypothetical protein
MMQTHAELIVPCVPSEVFGYVADLDRYPVWMGGLVHSAERVDEATAALPAWAVELRSRIGPLARSKKLRMVRTEMIPDRLAVFERQEIDGREHSVWRLRAELASHQTIEETGSLTASRLVMTLNYEGRLWTGGLLEKVLQDQIDAGRDRLLKILTQPTR